MKLQLKHLAPYLPYRLKYPVILDEIRIMEISLGNINNIIKAVNLQEESIEYKPILRPLRDLTKEEIIKLGYSGMHTLELAIQYDDLHYRDVRFFNENHYDYQGLIEKNLAIDINTL